MKQIVQKLCGRRKDLFSLAVLFVLCLAAELFLANYRDLSIKDVPETVIDTDSLSRADGAEVLSDGTISVKNAGAELEFTGLSVEAHAITIYTSASDGTVSIASVLLSDDAYQYDYRNGCRLYFNPAGEHCSTRGQLTSNGNLHKILISFDRMRTSFTVTRIVLNEKRGFFFDKLRFLLIFLLAFTIFICRRYHLTSVVYDPANPGHRAVICTSAGLCLACVFLIYRALASYGAADSIAWPLEKPVQEYSAYVQQFDAFQKGQLHLDLETDPRLKNLINAYDYSERTNKIDIQDWKQPYWDRVYYDGHYYSYFGIGPILTVYYPYYLLTGKLPGDAFVSMVYSAACVFLLFAVLEEFRRRFLPRVHLLFYSVGGITLFFGSMIPLVMVSSNFYYIAVNAAMTFMLLFFLLFFHAFSMPQGIRRRICAAGAGLAFVFLVLCRPNTVIAAVCAAAPAAVLYLLEKETSWKYKLCDMTAFLIPVAAGGILICTYNLLRFGSPTEFGASYQLTVSDITWNTIKADPAHLAAYIYYYFLQPLGSSLTFPFVEMNKDALFTVGNYLYHAASMGLFDIPLYLFLCLIIHPSNRKEALAERLTQVGILAGCILVSFLNFSLGGIFVRYLCDVTLPLGLLALLLALKYESRITEGRFTRHIILLLFGISIFIGAMFIFSNENCSLLSYAPEYYLRVMNLFRL